MADSLTANYELVKPEIGASNNTWGGKTNADWDAVDSLIKTLDFLSAVSKATPILADRIPVIDTETDPDTTKYVTFTQLKTLILAAVSLPDNIFEVIDNTDGTKKLQFQLSGITTATTRTLTIPDLSGTIVLAAGAQTLTDKTLTQPIIVLKQSAAEAPTAEGDVRWDSDDNVLVIGDGAATKIFAALPSGAAEDDLLTVGAGGKSLVRIPKGTALQKLRMNAGATAQEWATDASDVYTGSDVSNLDYPVGTTIHANVDTSYDRNEAAVVRLTTNNIGFSTFGAGTALVGTWRCRGASSNQGGSGDQSQQPFQRTA